MEKKTDLRIIKTHKALCDTFLILLDEKKFEDITINELCDRALVRRATFYNHFADKYDFFGFFVREIQADFASEIEESNENVPYAFSLALMNKCIDFFNVHKTLVDRVLESNMFSTLLDIFAEEVYRDVIVRFREDAQSIPIFGISTEILASFYTGGIIYTLRYWLSNRDKISEEYLIQELKKIFKQFVAVHN